MAAKHLFAPSDLRLFEALAEAPVTLDALAARVGLTRRAARISADAMVALGLLERDDELYRNSRVSAAFLAGTTPADLRPLLRFWDKISYPAWHALSQALGSGPPREVFDLDDTQQAIASAGIEAVLAGTAAALGEVVDFANYRRLLDIGGGTGSWSIAALTRHPHLRATVYELPGTAEIARRRIAEAGLDDLIAVVAGDVRTAHLPTGHEVFLLANVVHYYSPADNTDLLRRIRDAALEGGLLLLADFWRTARTPTRSRRHSWPASSPCTCAKATSTASTKSAAGCPSPTGASSSTFRSAARRAWSSQEPLRSGESNRRNRSYPLPLCARRGRPARV